MKQYYLTYFHTKCNPRVKYYDDDDDINQTQAVRVEKITHQIYVSLLQPYIKLLLGVIPLLVYTVKC